MPTQDEPIAQYLREALASSSEPETTILTEKRR